MRNIIEWFFPSIPKGEEEKEQRKIKADEIQGDINALKLKSDITYRGYQEEFERMRTTEGKASMFIGTTGFLATIVVGVTTLLVSEQQIGILILFLIGITGILTFYMARTISYSVKAMRRQTFTSIDPASVTRNADEEAQLKENIADYINASKKNAYVINRKVEFSFMAQQYFKRAVFSLMFYVIALLLYAIAHSDIPLYDYYTAVIDEVSTWKLEVWYMITTSVLLVMSLFLSSLALYKLKQKEH